MNDRTIMQMEVHPEIIRRNRARAFIRGLLSAWASSFQIQEDIDRVFREDACGVSTSGVRIPMRHLFSIGGPN